jgi:squalene-hopene/tetraprenyl-beta-curcumene cyclase
MESDDHYGATLAAIAVGSAPDGYARTELAQRGLERLRIYFKNNPGTTLHHRAMILWGNSYVEGILTPNDKQQVLDELLALQKSDGGWGLATMGDWKRADGMPQDVESSDGYGTGFAIYILRRGGLAATDLRIQKGLAWLKSHQRQSGRWFTRSLFKDNKHYITHAGTAFAVMAIQECDSK